MGTQGNAPSTNPARHLLSQHSTAIQRFREENAELKEELLMESKSSIAPTNPALAATIEQLEQETHSLTGQIRAAYEQRALLQEESQQLQAAIWDHRQIMGGIDSAAQHNQHLAKVLELQENRLHSLYTRVNTAHTTGNELRVKINNLRREKLAFESAYRKLERQVCEAKAKIVWLIHQYQTEVQGHNQATEELAKLQQRADAEQTALEHEWKRLTAIIDHARRQQEQQRAQEIIAIEQETQQLLARTTAPPATSTRSARTSTATALHTMHAGAPGAGGSAPGGVPPTTTASVRGSVLRVRPPSQPTPSNGGNATASHTNNTLHNMMGQGTAAAQQLTVAQRLQQLMAVRDHVLKGTGLSSLEHVAEHMTSAEERTLGLLSYVNDLHSEVEVLEDNIGQLRSELAWLQGQQQGRQAGRGTLVQELNEKVQAAEAVAAMYEHKQAAMQRMQGQLLEQLRDVLRRVGGDPSRIAPSTTITTPLNGTPLLTALATLEAHANHVLTEYADALVEACPNDPLAAVALPTAEVVGARDMMMLVVPPSVGGGEGEEEEEGGEGGEPLVTQEQLRASAQRALSRRAENAALAAQQQAQPMGKHQVMGKSGVQGPRLPLGTVKR